MPPGRSMCRDCRRIRRESSAVPDVDLQAMTRLMPFVFDAIAKQPPHVADQLNAALRQGDTSFRLEQSAVAPVVVVVVAGVEVAEVDVRILVGDVS